MGRSFLVGLGVGMCALGSAQFVNGHFEAGSLAGWTVTPTAIGATAIADAFQYDIDGPGPLGTNFAGRFSVGRATTSTAQEGISLTQSMNLTAGNQYTFDFDWSSFRTTTSSNAEGGVFSFYVNGVAMGTQSSGSTSSATPHYGHITVNFTPTLSGAHTVGALITRPFTIPTPTAPTLFQAVDNFRVTGVPEPASLSVLGLGVAAILRRRRRR